MSDGELLASYATHGSRPALARLVERHAPMVYATCLRVTGNRQLAEDATQAVFLMLTRGASRLAGERVLCGWLHSAAYRAACRAREREENEEVYIETRELAAVD
jgi:RNA polymerase sigma-70 factor (ECF subfamily)